MDNNVKTVIVAKDGKAEILTGSHFIELQDESRTTFHTANIDEFTRFVSPCASGSSFSIYYSPTKLWLYDLSTPTRYTEPIAFCELTESEYLTKIRSVNNKTFNLKEFEELLNTLSSYYNAAGRQLLDWCKNIKLTTVTDVEIKKDNRGNFMHSVKYVTKSKDTKNDDVEFPEIVTFTIPIYKYHNDMVDIPLKFFFSHEQVEDKISLKFTLRNFDFDKLVNDRQETIINYYIEKIPCNKWRGKLHITKNDDSWKYKPNPMRD